MAVVRPTELEIGMGIKIDGLIVEKRVVHEERASVELQGEGGQGIDLPSRVESTGYPAYDTSLQEHRQHRVDALG